jgi:hypothetical protein
MRRLGAAVALVLSPLGLAAGCVDGVTPDCSDAATSCGPAVDASADSARLDATPAPEAAVLDGAAEASPDLDAGDEG